jgi:hypothetical protein
VGSVLYTRSIFQGPEAPALTQQIRFRGRNSNRTVERDPLGRVWDGASQDSQSRVRRAGLARLVGGAWSVEGNLFERRVGARNPILQPSHLVLL